MLDRSIGGNLEKRDKGTKRQRDIETVCHSRLTDALRDFSTSGNLKERHRGTEAQRHEETNCHSRSAYTSLD
jgi:hypothetical protein